MLATACAAWYERQLQDTTISYDRQHRPQTQSRAKAATVGEKTAGHGDREKQKNHAAKQKKGAENDTISEKLERVMEERVCADTGLCYTIAVGLGLHLMMTHGSHAKTYKGTQNF